MRQFRIVCLALGGLRRRPLRVALTCLGVTIASGALVSMVGFALGVQIRAEAPFKQLELIKTIEVSPKNEDRQEDEVDETREDQQQDREEDRPLLDDAVLGKIESLPGVAAAYPDFRLNDIKVIRGENTQTGIAVGLPREAGLFGFMRDLLVAGGPFTVGDAPEAILGRRLAKDLGFENPRDAIGAVVTLEGAGLSPDAAASFTFQRKEFSVKVVGVFAPPPMGRGFMGRSLLLPIDLMKEIPGIRFSAALQHLRADKATEATGYQSAIVRVHHPRDLANVERAVRDMGFETRTLLSELEEMRTFFLFLDVLLACVGTVALVVAGLGIVNTLLMSVLERYQEIGICKAIGASRGDLVVMFLTEAAMIGFLGGLGGLVLGRVVSELLQIAVNGYVQSQGVDVYLKVFVFPFWLLAGAVLFSVTVAAVAGVYPAIRATRVDPIKALRGE